MRGFYIIVLLLVVNYSFAQCPTDEADLADGGTFSGTCNVVIDANIVITGAVDFTSGTLTLDGAGAAGNVIVNSGAGSITIQSGAMLTIEDGSLTVGGDRSFSSSGTVSVNNGISISGDATTVGFLTGSTTTLNGDFDILDSDVTIAGVFTDSNADDDEILLRGTSVLTINTGANVSNFDDIEFRNMDGISRLIINGGIVSINDDLDLRPASTDGDFVQVNGGTLDVGDNIALPDAMTNMLIINSGGTVTTTTINDVVITDPTDLPDGVVDNGGGVTVGGTTLPVELTSFSGHYDIENNSVMLNWNTASEINNDGFYLERSSIDTLVFEEIGFITGAGNSNQSINYEFEDINVFSSHYYRLRQVDFDGAFEFSNIILLKVESSELPDFEIKVYPNPSISSNIEIKGDSGVEFSVSLHTMEGKELFIVPVSNVNLTERLINNTLLNGNSGIYLLRYRNQAVNKVIRIIRQ